MPNCRLILLSAASTNMLREARRLIRLATELVSEEPRWTKDAFARDERDEPIAPHDTAARRVAWCAAGAILEADSRLFPGRRSTYDAAADAYLVSRRASLAVKTLGLSIVLSADAALLVDLATAVPEYQPPLSGDRPLKSDPGRHEQLLVLFAFAFNDLPETRHEHILQALGPAHDLIGAELRHRKESRS